MMIDLEKQKLPKIFKRQGRDCYLDPIREKLIFITPEETVRQKVISYLVNELEVPKNMIRVEEHLSHYGVESKRRADIIIEAVNETTNSIFPIAIVECKAPNVFIGEKEHFQAYDYADKLSSNYVMIINDQASLCYKYDDNTDTYILIEDLPNYTSMLKNKFTKLPLPVAPKRFNLEEIKKEYTYYLDYEIGIDTQVEMQYAMVNFLEGLMLDNNSKMECKNYGLFSLIDDYGVRSLSYGNHSGGKFFGDYRSFLIEYNGNTEFVSIGLSMINRNNKTSINVAIDDEKKSHHSLQLNVDDNVSQNGDIFKFYHSGKIAIGNIGSGKVSELKEYINKLYPEILVNDKIYLGSIKNDRLWNFDDENFKSLIVNMISYALIRDEYRKYKLDNSKD